MDKKPFDIFNTNISEEEIKRIKEKLVKSKIGADQLENPRRSYSPDELLEAIKNDVNLEEFENIAKLDTGGNQLKLIENLEQELEDIKIQKIQLKVSINKAQENGDIDLMIEYMLKYQNAKNLIASLEKNIEKIKDNN